MSEEVKLIVTFILVIASASYEGMNNAILWSRKGADAFTWNEHIVFVIQRGLFFAGMIYPGVMSATIAAIFAYPFFHNGFYYYYRNRIDGSYPKGFFADSTSSSAKINFNVRVRTILLIGSLVLLAFALLHK